MSSAVENRASGGRRRTCRIVLAVRRFSAAAPTLFLLVLCSAVAVVPAASGTRPAAARPLTRVTIGPSWLPTATTGVEYNRPVSVTGPASSYRTRVTLGAPPPGLSLEAGGLTGTPVVPGTFAFTISAFDQSGTYVAFHDYTMKVTVRPGSAEAAALYPAASFDGGIAAPWVTSGDGRQFRIVAGPHGHGHGLAITNFPQSLGPNPQSQLAAVSLAD